MEKAFYFDCYDPEHRNSASAAAIAKSAEEAREFLVSRYPQCKIAASPYHVRKAMGSVERIPRA